MNKFTLEALQAINDWQRGGNHQQKIKRGDRLKKVALALPDKFRSCTEPCYRQEAHEKGRIWKLLAENALPETIAAWTSDLKTAMDFKGGVPPQGWQGVILSITPTAGSIVLNLAEVYKDPDFQAAVAAHQSTITGFGDGIGRYGNTQHEVVLELGSLSQTAIYSYGGFASGRDVLAEQYYRRKPSLEDLREFETLCANANIPEGGEWWLSPEGTRRVLRRMEPHIEGLKKWKASHGTGPGD